MHDDFPLIGLGRALVIFSFNERDTRVAPGARAGRPPKSTRNMLNRRPIRRLDIKNYDREPGAEMLPTTTNINRSHYIGAPALPRPK
jgi:hypothetical protein